TFTYIHSFSLKLSKTSTSPEKGYIPKGNDKVEGFLGVDVGSISTNLAVIDKKGKLLSKRYLMTAGRPIEAVRKGLVEIKNELQDKVVIKGVCTTGSGRYLTGDFFGADVIRNEITAQATAAAFIDQRVDTIFEIGGQDSKYISLENGAIVDFEMNKVCAAGTGSFLEEQAEKLGVSIKKEFSKLALTADTPCAMGERCTVFMETDLVSNQRKGAKTDDLIGGLCYSIVYNYLNKVVSDRKVGDHIFFQGGTAFNDGVVAAFEAVTGKKITVPDNHEVTGAIGCALIAMKWYQETGGETRFKGFDRGSITYVQDSFECKACSNRCEINRVTVEGEKPLFYGGRCEKYEFKKKEKSQEIPDLFKEREDLLLKEYTRQNENIKSRGTVGIPRLLYNFEFMPFWVKFFRELGFKVVLSDPTNKEIINQGLESVLAEGCFPVKVAHGHVINLLKKDIDFLFLPSVLDMEIVYESYKESAPCPYGQAIPYMLVSAFDLDRHSRIKTLIPKIFFSKGERGIIKGMRQIAQDLDVRYREITPAVQAAIQAQKEFRAAIKERGREILAKLGKDDDAIVIVSRPYNGCDPGINLGLPEKLKELDSLAIPMDFLDLDSVPLEKDWPFMTWRYGQKILAAADIIRDDKRLNALYITNFGCGPDSFMMKFFRKRMGGKVYLQIEIDEHSADVGAITRCEAFLDSIHNIRKKIPEKFSLIIKSIDNKEKRTLYLPYMCDHAFGLKAAFASCEIPCEVLPESNMETLYWGRQFTSGKECYPCIVTTGDMVKLVKQPDFDPARSAFFMPAAGGGCRFGYYNILQRIVLDELGYKDVPIYSPHQTDSLLENFNKNVGGDFFRSCWNAIVGIDLLQKALHETRPYELEKGETEKVYWEYLQKVCNSILKKKEILPVMEKAKKSFEKIPVNREEIRPVIGVVGEIFVRLNRFSNNNIVKSLENLGAEVWVAPFGEWILYLNVINKEDFLEQKDLLSYARLFVEDKVAKNIEHNLTSPWEGFLRSAHEPKIEDNIKFGSDYVDPSYRGETILSLGKSVDYFQSGLSGVINLMPFTCMPGTIVNSQLKKLKEKCNNMPVLNIAYDGLDMTNNTLRLEAFVHQCGQFMQKNIVAGVH
ncbi:MAG: acyl-CoA dehydratase activase-related protein, partial [Vulcanimicrobiota bacterium]